jgi:hypothetical protein
VLPDRLLELPIFLLKLVKMLQEHFAVLLVRICQLEALQLALKNCLLSQIMLLCLTQNEYEQWAGKTQI